MVLNYILVGCPWLTRKRHLTLVSLWCGRTGGWAGGWAYGHVITKFRGYISWPILLYHPLPIESFTIKVPPSNKHRTEMKELCTQSSKYGTPFTSSSSFCSISSCKSLSRSASSSYFQNVKEYSMKKRNIDIKKWLASLPFPPCEFHPVWSTKLLYFKNSCNLGFNLVSSVPMP